MLTANFVLLHVDNPSRSAGFYASLLGMQPIESSPTFALFALPSGLMLGLWSRHTVEPATGGQPGAAEVAFTVGTAAEVDGTHRAWAERGLAILQPPTDMDFGRSFVAQDPDGHRLRVFWPAAEA